jgi:prevent-host-death family protein
MNVTTLDSQEAHTKWSDLLDATAAGETDVVITLSGKPAAVLIDYDDYLAWQEELDDLRAARRAVAAVAEWEQDPTTARPWSEFKAELIAEGLLDDPAE